MTETDPNTGLPESLLLWYRAERPMPETAWVRVPIERQRQMAAAATQVHLERSLSWVACLADPGEAARQIDGGVLARRRQALRAIEEERDRQLQAARERRMRGRR